MSSITSTVISRLRLGVVAAGTLTAMALFTPSASALALQPGGLVVSPAYCTAFYGTPDPCPAPDRPTPIKDPACLRVDVEPLHCLYLD
jgi:hypothetical protein